MTPERGPKFYGPFSSVTITFVSQDKQSAEHAQVRPGLFLIIFCHYIGTEVRKFHDSGFSDLIKYCNPPSPIHFHLQVR